jgi:RNA polymerase sigma-70 factor (ECF subfamily)
VSALLPKDKTPQPPGKGTLGELLYGDPAKVRVPESEWADLVRAVAARDARALHALYLRAHRVVFTLGLRICGDRQTAEEVTVDVFHEVWLRAPAYDAAAGTVLGWIMNVARSRAIDRVRHDRRKKRVDPSPHVEASAPGTGDGIDGVDLAELGHALRGALAQLTADERQAIETAYFADMTYPEVAARLQQPLGTIKTRIRSGLGKLRRALGGKDAP